MRRKRRSRRKGEGKESEGEIADKERVQFAFYISRFEKRVGACSILSDDVCITIDNLVGELA
jgi:hypothetical protein